MVNVNTQVLLGRQRWFVLFALVGCGVFFYGLHLNNIKNSNAKKGSEVPAFQIQNISPDPNKIFGETEFNLMEDYSPNYFTDDYAPCSLEWINRKKLPQDHPCVLKLLRQNYVHPPADRQIPYFLSNPKVNDTSVGQSTAILNYLKNKTEGFFIECGALEGEHLSNTLLMERFYNWGGILIEADQKSFGQLLSRRRKSYALPVCLSLHPYPTQVTFKVQYAVGSVQENDDLPSSRETSASSDKMLTVQCFPLYSILLAVDRTDVDFFSLDVEGHELKILKTIPWHRVDIKTFSIEWDHVGKQPLIDYLEPRGYYVFGTNTISVGADLFFAKKELKE